MRFYSFGEESFDKLARSKVGDVSAGLLYYLFSGRNASERRASLEKDDVQADPTTLANSDAIRPPIPI